jgi:hypothetical protein
VTLGEADDEEAIRLTAYFLWEQDGRPHGRHDAYWLRARKMHARQRAFDSRLEDNGPDDVGLSGGGQQPDGAGSIRSEDV